ncbi:MAG TPA: alpha-glucan family phosphorylase [Gemmatimonadales bacterium]|nr:alpha-glucan family phosphorylase [Gemmatimonadales bacterium]
MNPALRAKMPALPPALEGLASLAGNLSWSWHRQARALFKNLDEVTWHRTRHNPIRFLNEIEPSRLERAAADPTFVAELERVLQWMEGEQSNEHTWFGRTWPDLRERPVAYFCAEFGFHNSVPIYSGGLGILAGDHCKGSSDLGLPLVAVGLFYQRGYFDQRVRLDGWQEDSDEIVAPDLIPITPLTGMRGVPYIAVIQTFGRPVHVRVWSMRVGRVPVYLMDTALEENHPDDRALLSKLYGEGEDLRLRQEWILGAGGVRVLRALGQEPAVWHANEGHASFMMLERVRELVASGKSFEEAVAAVRATSVFTTHTPVPAGHDNFDATHVADCMGPIWEELGISREHLFQLAENPRQPGRFDMTALAMRLSTHVNGVSQRHGLVSRTMWKGLWPDRPDLQVPIGAITNGVHLATWMANPMMELLDRHLGPDWWSWWTRLDNSKQEERIRTIDDLDLWRVHQGLREVLFRFMREDARRRFADDWKEATQVVGAGALLDPDAFTIGFARRFATYKRANLIFRDPERLHRLLVNARRPVQLIVAGKAHPADHPGKLMLQSVYRFTHDPFYEGRVAFVQDYGMYPAHILVQGVDLWLNLPRVPMEASGTSGMKAALNGVPQLSTEDGWWEEAWDGTNGWTIRRPATEIPPEDADARDAEELYRLLEQEVVPLYYDRDERGIPAGWVDRMRNALRVAVGHFTAHRMLREYTERYYVPSMRGDVSADDPPTV